MYKNTHLKRHRWKDDKMERLKDFPHWNSTTNSGDLWTTGRSLSSPQHLTAAFFWLSFLQCLIYPHLPTKSRASFMSMLPRLGDLHSLEFDSTDASENNDIMKQCCYHYNDLTTAPEFEGKDSRDVCLDSNRAHPQALAGNPVSSTHRNPDRPGYRTW